ncbi:MAG: YfhO family protein, partial [Chloroflexi bacterium]|nr:YfhO family protein [Chloroflexota bacterium]
MKHAISSKKLDIAVLILLCLSAAALLRQSLLPSHTLLPLDLIYTIAPWHDPDVAPLQNSLLSDPFYSFYPRRVLLTESIRNGELPLWNPTIMAGTPNIANPNFQLFYPPNLLAALILPADQSLPWLAWVHLVMAGGLMYLFLKRHKLAIGACALGAVVWMLNGYTLVWLENPHRLSTTAWITAVFWAFETAVQRKNPAWAAGGGLFLGMAILGGQVQFIFAVGVIFGLYGLMILIDALWKKQRANAVQILGYMAVVGIIGLGIGSLLLIPAMEFAQISQRVTFNADSILNTRWQPTHLITLLAPDLYGNPIKQGYWGKANYAEMTAYFGVVALILGITAPAVARKTRFAVQTYVISTVVLLLVLGTWLARLLFLIPGAQFLSLNRLLFLVPFAGTWLAAIALDGWWQGVSKRQTAVSLTSVIILLTSLFIWTQRSLGEQFTQHQSSIWPDVVRGGGIATAVTVLLLLIKKWPLPVMTLLIIIACVDLLQWGWAFNPITPVTMLYPENELTTFLEQDDGLHRVLALQSGKVLFGPNVLSLYNKQTIGGYTPLIPKNYQQLYKSIDDQVEISWMAPNRNMLVMSHFNPAVSLLNVKYVLSVNPLNVDIVPQGSQLGCNEQIAIPTTQTISIADAGFNRLDLFFASLPTHSDEKVDISIRH